MACVKRGGVDRVLKKLEKSIEDGNYYEAHQMYRTLYFRYASKEQYTEAVELLYSGGLTLLEHEQFSSGADLCLLMIEVFIKSKQEVNEDRMDKISMLHSLTPQSLPERPNIVSQSIRWSSQNGFKSGHPFLHQRFAKICWIERAWQQSRYHYIHSTDGEGCASMLVDFQLTAGYPSEADIFVAQAVLQYLCLKKKSSAHRCFEVYTAVHPHIEEGPPYIRPLLNFIWMLLLAIEGGKLAVFTVLCEKYQPSLQRDPTYNEYLDRIGQLFFGVPAPAENTNQGFLAQMLFGGGGTGNLLQSLFSSDENSEGPGVTASPNPSRSSTSLMQVEDLD